MVKFSILVPVYNVEMYIKECVDSLINQDYSNYEIVLVDDGSTDDSARICDEYCKKYPNIIKVIHQENKGLLMARRVGIKNAIGDYFIFVDSDDFVDERLLKKLSSIIEKSNPDMVIFHADIFDGVEYLYFRKTLYENDCLISGDDISEYQEATLRHTISNGMWGKAVSRKIVDIEKDYSNFQMVSIGEDLLQSLPYITNSKSIYFCNDILYHYRKNPMSMTHNMKFDRYYSLKTVEAELEKYAVNWKCHDLAELILYHSLNEVVWGTLRTISKSSTHIFSEELSDYLLTMSSDSDMRNKYSHSSKQYFNLIQKITLKALYSKNFVLLRILLLLFRYVK